MSHYYGLHHNNLFKPSQFLEEDPEVQRSKVICSNEMSLG